MNHALVPFDLVAASPATWASMPNNEDLLRWVALAVLSHSELTGTSLGFDGTPGRIRNVTLTVAARDQINCMWHGHRAIEAHSPPSIPLKYFVTGFGQNAPDTWADIEVLPGLDRWEVLDT
jgi:hypothetical protein